MNTTVLVALIAALASPVFAYIMAVRKFSGSVGSSAAAELWEESRSIRQDLQKRNELLRQVLDKCESRIDILEKRIVELEEKNHELHLENGTLKAMLKEQEKTIAELRNQMHRLSDENVALKKQNGKLQKRVRELENA